MFVITHIFKLQILWPKMLRTISNSIVLAILIALWLSIKTSGPQTDFPVPKGEGTWNLNTLQCWKAHGQTLSFSSESHIDKLFF